MKFLCRLNDPTVRALAWSVFSQPLFNTLGGYKSPHFGLTEQRQQWLLSLNDDSVHLRKFMEEHCHSKRLGIVFERLWRYFLECDPLTELIANNLAVYDGGRTLGEFDLLYFCHKRQRAVHLELAVKYYLYTPQRSDHPLSCWLGPDSRDRLDLKVTRLLEHQLPLAKSEAGVATITALTSNSRFEGHKVDDFEQEIMVQGILFYPPSVVPPSPCPLLASNHQRGLYIPCDAAPKNSDWLGLEKPEWLDGMSDKPRRYTDQLAIVVKTHRALMFRQSDDAKSPNRIFITPNSWPKNLGETHS